MILSSPKIVELKPERLYEMFRDMQGIDCSNLSNIKIKVVFSQYFYY